MALAERRVVVKQLPATFDRNDEREFLRVLESEIAQLVRPCVVLDCSRLRGINKNILHLLLCSLEAAMKRNGDVKLAGVPAQALPLLQTAGLLRLFHIYPSTVEAVHSFRRPAAIPKAPPSSAGAAEQSAANAA